MTPPLALPLPSASFTSHEYLCNSYHISIINFYSQETVFLKPGRLEQSLLSTMASESSKYPYNPPPQQQQQTKHKNREIKNYQLLLEKPFLSP